MYKIKLKVVTALLLVFILSMESTGILAQASYPHTGTERYESPEAETAEETENREQNVTDTSEQKESAQEEQSDSSETGAGSPADGQERPRQESEAEDSDEKEIETEPVADALMAAVPFSGSISSAAQFKEAVNNLPSGSTAEFELTSDIIVSETYSINADNVTIKITGDKKITVTADYLFLVTGNNTKIVLDKIKISGGGFQLRKAGLTFELTGSNGAAMLDEGCAIDAASYLSSGSASYITVTGMTFTGNTGVKFEANFKGSKVTADRNGGAIAMLGGTLKVSDCKFTGNQTGFQGGAIYADRAVTTINKCTFTNNRAAYGGAIYTDSGSVAAAASTFSGNLATDEKATGNWNNMGGAICTGTGAITISGGSFEDNQAVVSANQSTTRDAYGGAVRTDSGAIKVEKTKFSGNSATWGGAIYGYNSNVTLTESTMDGNTVSPNEKSSYDQCGGGAVSIYLGQINVSGGTYTNNKVKGGSNSYTGGGVMNTEAGKVSIVGGTFKGNEAAMVGGAVFVRNSNTSTVVSISGDAKFENNKAATNGGAICSYGRTDISNAVLTSNNANVGGAVSITGAMALTVAHTKITSNKALIGSGGAIFSSSGSVSISASEISGNEAALSGGGIYVGSGAFSLINDSKVHSNTAKMSDGTSGGGGVYVASGAATLTNSSIYNNTTAGSGGGVATYNGSITMNSGSIYGNTANGNGGGGIAVYSGSFTMNGGTIGGKGQGNKALITGSTSGGTLGNGGGVFMIYGTMKTTGGTISYNEAQSGGGIYLNGQLNNSRAVFDLSGIEIANNQAKESGGGIFANIRSKEVKVNKTKVTGNTSAKYGGGIYLNSEGMDVTSVWSNNEITDNKSERGAGLYVQGKGSLGLKDSKVNKNTASVGGGGIYAYLDLTLTGVEVEGNKTTGTYGGGVVANGLNAKVTLDGSTIENNSSAGYGGGIYIFEKGAVTVKNETVISNNIAKTSGGGIYLSTGSLDAGGEANRYISIENNKAETGSGGGIYVRNGSLALTYTKINKNTAKVNGGGVYLLLAEAGTGDTISAIQAIDYNIVNENKAEGSGGGLYIHINAGGVSNSITGNEVAGNKAYDGGGVYLNYQGTGELVHSNKVHDNKATHNGGGFYITGRGESIASANRMSLTVDEISDNEAGHDGGGIYLTDSDLVLLNAYDKYKESSAYAALNGGPSIHDNRAGGSGGGIYITAGSTMEVWRMTAISDNKAAEYGGGIYVEPSSTVTFKNDNFDKYTGTAKKNAWIYITGNSAQHGGGIYGIGTGMNIINTVITGNTAHTDKDEGNGGGIWLMHSNLKDLNVKNVMFVYDGKTNKADTGHPILFEDQNLYKDNIITTSEFSWKDNTTGFDYNAYNNYDIAYDSTTHTVMFNANGGALVTNGLNAPGTPGILDTASEILAESYKDGDQIGYSGIPAVVEREDAVFIGWFQVKEENAALPNSRTADLSKYKDLYLGVNDILGTTVKTDLIYVAGWLYAPTIDDVYDSGVYGADKKVTGTGNPNAQITVTYNSQSVETVVNDNGTWEVDFNAVSFKANEKITAVQEYITVYPGVESPKGEAEVLDGYKVVYHSGYDYSNENEITHTHKAGNKEYTKFTASYQFDLAGNDTFKRTGYELGGWSLENNSSQATYNFKEKLNIGTLIENEAVVNNTITLYGVWSTESYKVTYDAGTLKGSVAVPSDLNDYTINGQATILPMTDSAPGYYFTGWILKGDNTEYKPGSQYIFSGNNAKSITLTAQWEMEPDIEVKKKVNSPGEVKTGDELTYTITATNKGKGDWLDGTLSDILPEQLSIDGENKDSIKLGGNASAAGTPAISYNGSSGRYEISLSGITLKEKETLTLTLTTAVGTSENVGEKFTNTVTVSGEDKAGNKYTDEDTSEASTIAVFSVTYHKGTDIVKGQVPVDDNAYHYREKVEVYDGGTLNYDRYYFAGWSTNKKYNPEEPSGMFYRPGDIFDITENTDLYAIFYRNPTIDIELYKKDADANNKALGGAEFELKRLVSGTSEDDYVWEEVFRGTTDEAGYLKIPGLEEGSYRGYETTPPDGYMYPVGNSNYITIEVTAETASATGIKTLSVSFPSLVKVDGKVNPSGWVDSVEADKQILTAYNKKETAPYAKLILTKTDEDGAGVDGAQFTLFKKVGDEWQMLGGSHTAHEEGGVQLFSWNTLTAGVYQIRETKVPDGFIPSSNDYVEFEITAKGRELTMTPIGKLPLGASRIDAEDVLGSAADDTKVYAFQMTNVHGVELQKITEAEEVYLGDTFTYDIVMTNHSTILEWDGSFTDTLPEGLEYISHQIEGSDVQVQLSDNKRTLEITCVPLHKGEHAVVRVTVKAVKGGSWINTVRGSVNAGEGYQADLEADAQEVIVALRVNYHKGTEAIKGEVPADDIAYRYEAEAAVQADGTLAYAGHYFAGWSTSKAYDPKNPSGKFYRPGDTFTITEDVDLYAVFYKNPTVDIDLYKRDADNREILLAGAEFELKRLVSGTSENEYIWEEVFRGTSDENGYLKITSLEEGIYRGYETTPPDGYMYPVGNSNYITFEVTADTDPETGMKELKVAFPSLTQIDDGWNPDGWVDSVYAEGLDLTALSRKETNPYARLLLTKVDEEGTSIADAQFTLFKWVDESSDWQMVGGSHISHEEGDEQVFSWNTLTAGTYQILETKVPDNFVRVSEVSVEFRLEEHGDELIMTTDEKLPPGVEEITSEDFLRKFTTDKAKTYAFQMTNIHGVKLQKTTETTEAYLGEEFTYDITIANQSKTVNWKGTFEDTLPKGLEYVSHKSEGADVQALRSGDNQSIEIVCETLPAGEEVQVEITVKAVEAVDPGTWVNTVSGHIKSEEGYEADLEAEAEEVAAVLRVNYYKGSETIKGETPVDKRAYRYDEQVVVEDDGTMNYDGYYFAGWSTSKEYDPEKPDGEFYRPRDRFAITADVDLYAVFYRNPTVDIELNKKDAELKEPLDGAEFLLMKLPDGAEDTREAWDNAEEIGRYISGANGTKGHVKFAGLGEGTYRGYEATAPDGYRYPVGNSNYITLEVTASTDPGTGVKTLSVQYPTLKWVDGMETDSGYVESVSVEENILTAYNEEETEPYVKLILAKEDEAGKSVKGAQFTLFKWNTLAREWEMVGASHTSQEEEKMQVFSWNTLTAGRYQIRETKVPDTFIKASQEYAVFEVKEDGDGLQMIQEGELPLGVVQVEPEELFNDFTPDDVKVYAFRMTNVHGVEVQKKAEKTKVYTGDEFIYEISLKNHSETLEWQGTVTDRLPAGLEYVSHEVTGEAVEVQVDKDSQILDIILNPLRKGENAKVHITVKAVEAGTWINTVTGSIKAEAGENKEYQTDLEAEAEEVIVDKLPLLEKRLADPDQVKLNVGDTFGYTVKVTNPGNTAWTGTLIDKLPEGMEYIEDSISSIPFEQVIEVETDADRLTLFIRELAPGDTIEIAFEVCAVKAGTYINSILGEFKDEEEREYSITDDAEEVEISNEDGDNEKPVPPIDPPKPEKSKPPVFDKIYEGDKNVKGDGIPGSTVIVTFPDGTQVDTMVGENGRWSVEVPNGIKLNAGEILSAIQIEPGKLASDAAKEPVRPLKSEKETRKNKKKSEDSKNNRKTRGLRTGDMTDILTPLSVTAIAMMLFVILLWKKRRKF